jgi:hypothetical protein
MGARCLAAADVAWPSIRAIVAPVDAVVEAPDVADLGGARVAATFDWACVRLFIYYAHFLNHVCGVYVCMHIHTQAIHVTLVRAVYS